MPSSYLASVHEGDELLFKTLLSCEPPSLVSLRIAVSLHVTSCDVSTNPFFPPPSLFLAGTNEERPTTMLRIVPITRLFGHRGRIRKTLGGNTRLEAGSFMPIGTLTRETIMTPAITMTPGNTETTGETLMSKTSGSTATGSASASGLSLTESTSGGPWKGAKAPLTPGGRRAPAPPLRSRSGCRAIPRGGSTAALRSAAAVAAPFLLPITTSWRKAASSATPKMKKRKKSGLLNRSDRRKTSAR